MDRKLREIRDFYDHIYYKDATASPDLPAHLLRLAARLGPWHGQKLLDVACGTGEWLRAAAELGAEPAGIDISRVAIEVCRQVLPKADLPCGPAENLPFGDGSFDVVSCLGSLEHFVEPERVLREITRVAKGDAILLFLVPNADFLTRRLGLYLGTQQSQVHEEARTLRGWQQLFEAEGLHITDCWKDLHVLSFSWIMSGCWYTWPLRAVQALVLPTWPLSWQYQVYFRCKLAKATL